jgi:hypothetical protein
MRDGHKVVAPYIIKPVENNFLRCKENVAMFDAGAEWQIFVWSLVQSPAIRGEN